MREQVQSTLSQSLEAMECDPVAAGEYRNANGPVLWTLVSGLLVELEIDIREQAVFCLISLPVDDGPSPGYYVCNGTRVRWHAHQLLSELGDGKSVERVASSQHFSGPQAVARQAEVVLGEVLSHRLEVLNAVRHRMDRLPPEQLGELRTSMAEVDEAGR